MNKSRLRFGCVTILVLTMLVCGATPFLNWAKWKLTEPENYLIHILEFRPPSGSLPYQVRVENGAIKEVAISSIPRQQISISKGITIDSLFLRIPECVIMMPFGWCEIDYNAEYGYPQSISYSWGEWINVNLLETGDGTE
jgi:hypothetical protein